MERKPKRVALFVGVDKYSKDASIPPLSGAVADAKALHEFFSSRPNQFDVAEILENPTSDDVFDKVESLSSDLREGDLFMFYFAGHGMVDGGNQKLLCSNTRQGRGSLTNEFDIRNVAGNEKWNVAVVLDACRSRLDGARGVGDRVCDGKRDLAFYDALVRSRRPEDASLTVLFSCDEGKTAGEVKGRNHGLFTLALLDVLERADKDGTPWCFDQNLGDEIGRTMRRLADNDSGQRPWIKASGTPPLFFLPSMDLKPLVEWTRNLQDSGMLSLGESAECQKALGATSPGPRAKGIFETIRFFSQWKESRKLESVPEETAVAVIKALCHGTDEPPIPSVAFQGSSAEFQTAAENPRPSRPLSRAERDRIATIAGGVERRYWREEGRTETAARIDAIRAAATESEAVAALRGLERLVFDDFRDHCHEGMPCARLPNFFTRNYLEFRRRNPVGAGFGVSEEFSKAVDSFERTVGTCCQTYRAYSY